MYFYCHSLKIDLLDQGYPGEESRLRVSENRVLRRTFQPKREEVAGGWRRLHNEELHNLHTTSKVVMIKSRRMRWAGRVERMEEMRNDYKMFTGKPDGKIPRGKHGHKWEDNIRYVLRKYGGEGVD
jgi:hypothetical protein